MLAHRKGQANIIWRNTPACCVAETYNFLSFRGEWWFIEKYISLRPFVGQLVILQCTFWNCAICGLLLVLANVVFRWAIGDSATVFL